MIRLTLLVVLIAWQVRYLLLVAGLVLVCWQGWERGYRLNVTPSLPKGIYKLKEEAPVVGDVVSICLEGEFADTARERGYLRPGSCKSGLRPLLKYLAALPGDAVDQSIESILCGRDDSLMCRWPVSVKAKDRQGREMRPAILPQTVPDGMALILTPHEGSFDSRYFGLVPLASLQKVEEVLCF